jgi:hypothetical protein
LRRDRLLDQRHEIEAQRALAADAQYPDRGAPQSEGVARAGRLLPDGEYSRERVEALA